MGRTTVLSHVHRIVGGVFLGVRQFLDALAARTPEAIEEAFLAMLDHALADTDLVIVDDLHLVTAIVDSCTYTRSYLLDAALTAVLTEAAARERGWSLGLPVRSPNPLAVAPIPSRLPNSALRITPASARHGCRRRSRPASTTRKSTDLLRR